MGVAARGIFSAPLEALRGMLSNCVPFQKLVQAANAAAALGSIFLSGAPGDTERPFAILDPEETARNSKSGGGRHYYQPGGKHKISFEMNMVWPAELTTVTDTTHVASTAWVGLADDFFNGLSLKVGEQAAVEITDFNGTTGALTLGTALSSLPSVGADAKIIPVTDEDALLFFTNTVGDIMEALEELSGTGGCIAVRSWRASDCGRSPQDQGSDDFFGVVVELEFGA